MKPFWILIFSFVLVQCVQNEDTEEFSCGTLFCSEQGMKEFISLKEIPTTQKTLLIGVKFSWFGSTKDYGGIQEINQQFDSLLLKMNEGFYGANIQFLKVRPSFYEDTLYIESEKAKKNDRALQNKYGNKNYINVFFVDRERNRLNGYTPILTEKFKNYSRTKLNLIVVVKKSLKKQSTIMHEMGHLFGLQHTFGENKESFSSNEELDMSNCSTSGDFICDTPTDPNIKIKNSDCSQLKTYSKEGVEFNPPFNNYMSYYPSYCRTEFSTGQLEFMNKFGNKYRGYLLYK